jgi:GNAT superfamily N-acetyltransferase
MNNNLNIRETEEKDVELILSFINDLAVYEKLQVSVVANKNSIKNALFGDKRYAECIIADYDGKPAGFALYFYNFSTFLAKPGLYLEDLFVKPEFRGKGIGKALLIKLTQIAKDNNCGRFEWSVLDWNEPAINFYKKLGAKPMDEWTVFRLDNENIDELPSHV